LALLCAAVTGIALLLLPDPAHAWGPITHLAHGSEVLKGFTILGAGLQQLLTSFPTEYLYGCIGADITLGKKYTAPMQAHCHSWDVGWQVLEEANTEAERAFAYGYLSHLAADVFSHNHFVPTQLVISFRARALRHVYWEARFDIMQDPEYRDIVRDLRKRRFAACDALVERVVARTIFSFKTNKRIFDSVLAFHDWDNWHRFMENVSERSRYHFPEHLVDDYNAACQANIFDVLRRGRHADCQEEDPSGLVALTTAKRLRRTLKNLERRGAVNEDLERQLAALNVRADLAPPPAGAAASGGDVRA
jgi:hypothetical protein